MIKAEWNNLSFSKQKAYEKRAEYLIDYGCVSGNSTKEIVNKIAKRIYEKDLF